MLRLILGVIVGVVAGMAVVFGVEMVSMALFPPPPGLGPADKAAMAAYIADMPVGAFVIVLAAFGLGAFAAAAVALLVAERRRIAGWIAAGVMLAATVWNLIEIPHPLWFSIAAVVVVALGGWLASRLLPARA